MMWYLRTCTNPTITKVTCIKLCTGICVLLCGGLCQFECLITHFCLIGEQISNKKDELIKILDKFNIQVDNPVSLLNQETSRNFLHSTNPKTLYQARICKNGTQLPTPTLSLNNVHEEQKWPHPEIFWCEHANKIVFQAGLFWFWNLKIVGLLVIL